MKIMWCWRCNTDIPMLDETEWAALKQALDQGKSRSPRERFDLALDCYHRLTGVRETNPNALWHHRISQYGLPCRHCGKPLRTIKAARCIACGEPHIH